MCGVPSEGPGDVTLNPKSCHPRGQGTYLPQERMAVFMLSNRRRSNLAMEKLASRAFLRLAKGVWG